jgi:hypothetical protein
LPRSASQGTRGSKPTIKQPSTVSDFHQGIVSKNCPR